MPMVYFGEFYPIDFPACCLFLKFFKTEKGNAGGSPLLTGFKSTPLYLYILSFESNHSLSFSSGCLVFQVSFMPHGPQSKPQES